MYGSASAERTAEILQLRQQGYSLTGIAKRFGITYGAVHQRIVRSEGRNKGPWQPRRPSAKERGAATAESAVVYDRAVAAHDEAQQELREAKVAVTRARRAVAAARRWEAASARRIIEESAVANKPRPVPKVRKKPAPIHFPA